MATSSLASSSLHCPWPSEWSESSSLPLPHFRMVCFCCIRSFVLWFCPSFEVQVEYSGEWQGGKSKTKNVASWMCLRYTDLVWLCLRSAEFLHNCEIGEDLATAR